PAQRPVLGRRGFGEAHAAARAGGGVEVERVRQVVVGVVVERHFDRVADAHAQHGAGDFAVVGPVMIGNAGGGIERSHHFLGGQLHADDLRAARADRRGNVAGVTDDGGDGGLVGGSRGRCGGGGGGHLHLLGGKAGHQKQGHRGS